MGKYDSAWKDIIKAHLQEFLMFYFPHVAESIDFSVPPVFLEKELEKLTPENESRGRLADLLIKLMCLSGEEYLLYTHVEIQGRKEPQFAERLFQYAYRIYDRFWSFPVTLVVLTDTDPSFYPSYFEITSYGRYLRVDFQVTKLLYLEERRRELTLSDNPFAFVTKVHMEVQRRSGNAKERRKDIELKYELKKELALQLYQAGYTPEYVQSLLLFLDWLVQLPRDLEWKLMGEISEKTGGKSMPYVTSWERMGIEKGKKERERIGRLEDKQEVLMRQLERKFGLTSKERDRVRSTADPDNLDSALDLILSATTKEEVLAKLQ
ncbi:MAG: hypothetical protein GF409_00545 [Candidatus Omnitrophica bacterium]|nr:hypothetical protein [Candidatus Omnitrophota bacterium]